MRKLLLLLFVITQISCSKDDECTDEIEVAVFSGGGRYNMSITFSGNGSLRNITPLVTGGEPFIVGEDEIPTYTFEWTYTPIDPAESIQIFYGENLPNMRAGKYCVKITDSFGISNSTCNGGPNDFKLVIEDVECSAIRINYMYE